MNRKRSRGQQRRRARRRAAARAATPVATRTSTPSRPTPDFLPAQRRWTWLVALVALLGGIGVGVGVAAAGLSPTIPEPTPSLLAAYPVVVLLGVAGQSLLRRPVALRPTAAYTGAAVALGLVVWAGLHLADAERWGLRYSGGDSLSLLSEGGLAFTVVVLLLTPATLAVGGLLSPRAGEAWSVRRDPVVGVFLGLGVSVAVTFALQLSVAASPAWTWWDDGGWSGYAMATFAVPALLGFGAVLALGTRQGRDAGEVLLLTAVLEAAVGFGVTALVDSSPIWIGGLLTLALMVAPFALPPILFQCRQKSSVDSPPPTPHGDPAG